jgi:hypothetical protein
VWEWNEQVVSGSYGVLRGGSWANIASGLAASSPFNFGGPSVEVDGVGFRVASLVPEPGTGLLVMTGVLGLAPWHKHTAKTL